VIPYSDGEVLDTPKSHVFNGNANVMERDELTTTVQLARLEVSGADAQRFEAAVAQMLEYFSKMRELDVDGLAPTTQLVDENRTRRDEPVQTGDVDVLLASAPELEDRFIVIPNVL